MVAPHDSGLSADPKAIVSALSADWAKFALAGAIPDLVNLYNDDAIFYGSLPRLFFGHAGVADYFGAVSLTSLTSVHFDWQQVRFIAPSVINAGGVTYFGMEIEGAPATWRFGISWVLVRLDTSWRIAAHHASPREL